MKTIREWLEELPEPYRTQAIENYNNQECNFNLRFGLKEQEHNSLKDALFSAFAWGHTEQGYEHWRFFHDTLND